MKRLLPAIMMIMLLAVGMAASAQDGSASSVTIFYVACENQGVVNLSGNMETGLDVYYQVFSGPGGTGTPLSNVRQVQVDGAYAFSETIAYTGGTIPAGGTGSIRVFIAREGNPASTASDIFTVDDLQDGCNNAQNPLGTSVDTGATGAGAVSGSSSGPKIRSPFGGYINPDLTLTPEPEVVLGARQSVNPQRSQTAGVIFAECDKYLPQAAPGLLYDTDNIVIFWSWYARTIAQVEDHIAQAEYSVQLNRAPLVGITVSPIQKLGANYWVFYTAQIGRLRPGQYGVEFRLNWKQAIFDGYANFGPDTKTPEMSATCSFTIERNPDNINVTDANLMYSVR